MAWGEFVPNLLVGLVRGNARPAYGEGDQRISLSNGGEVVVAHGLPSKTERVRQRNTWYVTIATGSAFQPVAAWPTTLANIVLYNGDPKKSYVIETVWASAITSIAAATSFSLLAQLSATGIAAPTDDTAQLISGRTGGTYGGFAKRAVANTAFALANKWDVIGESPGHPSTAIGAGVFADVDGGWVVRPGACFCTNVVASTAAGTMIQGISWTEIDLG